MTESENINLTPRESDETATTDAARLFAFWRLRSGAATRVFPLDAHLRFANRGDDTITATFPHGMTLSGDRLVARYRGVKCFEGSITILVESNTGGADAVDRVTFAGPWAAMGRLVYRQHWMTPTGWTWSSRLILNQYRDGTAQGLNSELGEIARHGAQACGYTVGTISVSDVCLPFDECRDLTIADAIRRELRLFPMATVRFDYSGEVPALIITRKSENTADASWLRSATVLAREKTYQNNTVSSVCLEIESTGTVDGVAYRTISHQADPPGATGGGLDCLYATIRRSGATSSTVRCSIESQTEDIPVNLNDKTWWMAKHPRLANLAAQAVTIRSGARSDSAETVQHPRISASSAGELEAAGLNCRVVQFTCEATIETAYSKESRIYLTMEFLTTDATTRRYTWVAESSVTPGETVPDGLAAALLEERSGMILSEKMTIRLGNAVPAVGDMVDGLPLQSIDIDCSDLTADLEFGAPEHLSPEDMASLLSCFRNKRSCGSATSRHTGRIADDGDEEVDLGGIKPLSATDWSPGVMSLQTLKTADGNSIVLDATSTSGGNIALRTSEIPSGTTIGAKTLTLTGAGANGADVTVPIVAGDDITINPGSGGQGSGAFAFNGTSIAGGYVYDGRTPVQAQAVTPSDVNGTWGVVLTHGSTPQYSTAAIQKVSSFAPTAATTTFPLYTIANGRITADYRGTFVAPLYE